LEGRAAGVPPASRPLAAPASAPSSLAWMDYAGGLTRARRERQPIVLEFYADW